MKKLPGLLVLLGENRKKYQVILADPPWEYKNKRTGGSMQSGSAAKYPTMSTDKLCQLNIANITDKSCVLFLWATVPMLEDGLKVMKSWGFSYKTLIMSPRSPQSYL